MADGMPFVLTAAMKQSLRQQGMTAAEIAALTPGQAHKLIMAGATLFTVIAAQKPARLGKRYVVGADGMLAKTSVAATPEALARALAEAAESTNQVVVLGNFIGARPGDPAEIQVVTERTLMHLVGGEIGDLPPGAPGYFTVSGGRIVSARLKRLMDEPRFVLIDADNPPGMPAEFAELDLADRLDCLEPILPGISTCRRIEYRGSSARVVNGAGLNRSEATHAIIEISDPAKLDLLRAYLRVESVRRGLSFPSPRFSRLEPGKVIGYAHLTLIDWSVWVAGRLIFNAKPDVAGALDYRVLDANVTIVNSDGGVLDIDWIKPPPPKALKEFEAATGAVLELDPSGRGAAQESGALTLLSEIESRGTVKRLGDWLPWMLDKDIAKLRCEAPFRASVSEAALIRILDNGDAFVHDSGLSTNYPLGPLPPTADGGAKAIAKAMTAAVIEALDRRAQRQASAAGAEPPDAMTPVDLWPDANPPILPEGLLPGRIETFARAAAKVVGADVSGFAMAGLAASAAAIPDSIQLRPMRHSPWTESARIWVALVGDPSARKTAILNAASAALKREDRRRYQDYLGRKAFFDALPKEDQKIARKPAAVRLILNDTSVEAAQEINKTSTEGVLGLYDELSGWFGSMDRFGQSGHAMADRSLWLQTYNGGSYIYDRIGRGSADLPNISMTLLGGIQPDLMRKVANACSDDGLIQRLIPVMLVPSVLAADDPQAADEMLDFDNLIPQLLALPPGGDPLRFDAGAQTIRNDLEIEHHGLVRAYEGFNKKLSTAIGKQDGVFARLCIVWHCVEHADQSFLPERVTEDIAERVAAFLRQFIRLHLTDFYTGTIDLSDDHGRLTAVAGYILTHKPQTLANWQVQAAVRSMRKLTSREITPVMEQLETLGWLFRGEQRRAGAPPLWTINPNVHTRYAERAKAESRQRADLRKLIAKDATARRREHADGA
jgi:hypothetical protein